MDGVMLLLVLRVAFMFCLYFLTLSCYLTPVLIVKCWGSRTLSISSPSRALRIRHVGFRCTSLCNCMASGILLAMCFLGLLPYVQEKFTLVFKKIEYKMNFPITECVVVLGFITTLFIEQMLMSWKERKEAFFQEDIEQGQGLLEECEMQDLSDDPSGIIQDNHNDHLDHDIRSKSFINNHNFCEENCISDVNEQPAGSGGINIECTYNSIPFFVRRESGFLFYVIAFASGMHSIFEGITLGLQVDIPKAVHLFIAIIIHECLVAVALGINSTRFRYSFVSYLRFAIIFSAAIPLGVIIGIAVEKAPGAGGELASAVLQGLSSGVFLHVIFQDFFPSEFSSSQDRILKVGFVFVGFIIIAVVTYFVNEY